MTKLHFREQDIATISMKVCEKGAIIKRNFPWRRWTLKINEPIRNDDDNVDNKKTWKIAVLYTVILCCLIIAIFFGVYLWIKNINIFKHIVHESNQTVVAEKTVCDQINKSEPHMTIIKNVCNCNESEEICMKLSETDKPKCVKMLNKMDPTGCGGLCRLNVQYCKKLDPNNQVYQCRDIKGILKCPDGTFNCRNRCIEKSERCDGVFDCSDHSDEFNCDCDLKNYFQCGGNTSCIENKRRCDGNVDCWDGSDENNCHKCTINEAPCRNGQCVPKNLFCDGTAHCIDKSDEPEGCLQ